MRRFAGGSIDVAEVRRVHPIHEVVAASGVELQPRGHGFVGCCPFHEDVTPSLSVGGVPDRFHCFGCGASGDVIDYVRRRFDLGFLEAVASLESGEPKPSREAALAPPRQPDRPTISRERAYEINDMAWDLFADPVGARFAYAYLHHHRSIDVRSLETVNGGPLAGRAGSGWTRLVGQLGRRGVTPDELRAVDLAQFTRHGSLIDTLRDRVVIPVRGRDGRIAGFIGRDVSGDPRGPKYRNPAHTPVFDKSLILYRPTLATPHPEATVVVVEGPLDALAIAATAAGADRADRVIPVSANGTAVSGPQAAQVCALAPAGIVLALDGDDAGRAGTERWLDALTLQRHRLPKVATLPARVDPADWLAEHGPAGLAAFGADAGADDAAGTPPRMPGRELVRACLPRARDPIRDTAHDILAAAKLTHGHDALQLIRQAEAEMTRQGWNPRGIFGHYLRGQAVQDLRDRLNTPPSPAWPPPPAQTAITR
jgi:DNA primase